MPRFALPRAAAALALFALLAALAAPAPVSAQPKAPPGPAPGKKVLTPAEYDIWRAATGVAISRDGAHVAYIAGREGQDAEVVVRAVATGKEYKFKRGAVSPLVATGPKFTPDSKRVLVPLTPTKAELEKAKAAKLKDDEVPKPALAVIDLASGTELGRIAGVGAFQVGGEGAGFVVYRKATAPAEGESKDGKGTGAPPAGKFPGKGTKGAQPPTPGTDPKGAAPAAPKGGSELFVRDLTSSVDRTVPDVTDYTLSTDETALVYATAAKADAKNGVFVLNPRFGTAPTAIKSGPGRYSGLAWDEKQTKLAFFYDDSTVPADNVAPPPRPVGGGAPVVVPAVPPKWQVFVWDRAERAAAKVFGPDAAGMRKGWKINATAATFSKDGTRLYVTAGPEREARPATAPAPTDEIQLDIWHWKDGPLQTMQKLTAAADRNKTYGGVIFLDTKEYRQLSDETVSVANPETGDWALAADDRKYRVMIGYETPLPRDLSLVNVRTGETKPLAAAVQTGYTLTSTGKFLIGFDGKDWQTISVPDGKKANLTAKLGAKFANEQHDTPTIAPPYGPAQPTTDGKFALLRDRFDIWKVALDGSSAENLTKIGRAQGIEFTISRPRSAEDRTPERGIDLSKPLLLSAENPTTRDTGFYRLAPGGAPKLLVMGPRAYNYGPASGGFGHVPPLKAKDADTYLLTVQSFAQYPDYYATGPDFRELTRVTDLNPQAKEYNWGRSELVSYKSSDGVPLQGILVKPENFDPTKKYPMIVYIYERLTENYHQFRVPTVSRGQVINPTIYASNGYLVLMPDIAYTVGAPGPSAIKCVLPAIQSVVDKGCVDEKAIGINGQSWGGYQIAYMITQTNRFKAAVAGAPVANMFSAYGGIRWGSGLPRQFQYEHGQSRIGATPWEAPLKYMENSPIFMADRVQTPLMMIHNDQDDAVPWYQGIEYYLALRRLGKEVYMLNYNGELHNLTKKATARDFAARMFQFFEHHLKGKPAPEWMEKGVPFLDREKEKEQFKKK
jgi:dipeptidyl aminopeptidase/acylaminoacyl peptidase